MHRHRCSFYQYQFSCFTTTELVWKFDHFAVIMRHSFVLVALSVVYRVTAGDFGTADCRCVRRLWALVCDASPLM